MVSPTVGYIRQSLRKMRLTVMINIAGATDKARHDLILFRLGQDNFWGRIVVIEV